jgi:hypothetical protein
MAVVYLHKRNDTNEVFYVGIGKTDKRAFSKHSRNKYWKHIVEKVGYTIDILVSQTPWEDACKLEKLLIEKYGRRDLGLGLLVNMTDGGEGINNPSEETKEKLRKANIGENNPMFGKKPHNLGKPHSDDARKKMSDAGKIKLFTEEHKNNISKANKGKPAPNKGIPISDETRKKLSEANKGEKHPMYGKKQSPEFIAKRIAKRLETINLKKLNNI